MPADKVLIVEDNADNLALLRMLLEREQYQVLVAYDGRAGLETTRSQKPDLILLDLDMPIIDGWEMIRQLKSDPDLQSTRIVVVTAHLLPGERHRVLNLGCDGYVSKPFKLHELLSEVQRVLVTRQ
ncbi:MAG: response regulator [Anaerolineales bacterium]|nr:response regulator [Anaerolineales bacterium]